VKNQPIPKQHSDIVGEFSGFFLDSLSVYPLVFKFYGVVQNTTMLQQA
jgi:hypothetical protein